ncbi:cell wall-associated hydrolase [Candidatus Thiomargarita nelsonii]|uniref:Cell wall-associated hydrolase n=1 Tax=Candidatus Thiomargarita nelsonii TaxID=1003181 RepID=A0A176RS83_9GAMM|nr:cell wall-associated hydrolase [Candidatus Thiomargarita nelsonii]
MQAVGMVVMEKTFKIPKPFIHVKYNPQRIPGVENQVNLNLGANCQVYAYELLRYFGKNPPMYRSSELWRDSQYTAKTKNYKILDLMLYNKTPQSYGAHVGIYVGNGNVLHLSSDIGYPVIQKHEELILQEKYSCFIGAKRVIS